MGDRDHELAKEWATQYRNISIGAQNPRTRNLAASYLDSQAKLEAAIDENDRIELLWQDERRAKESAESKLTAAHAQGDAMELQLEQCGRVQMQMQAQLEASRQVNKVLRTDADQNCTRATTSESRLEDEQRMTQCAIDEGVHQREKYIATESRLRVVEAALRECPMIAKAMGRKDIAEAIAIRTAAAQMPLPARIGSVSHETDSREVESVPLVESTAATTSAPAAALLPGLERAEEICENEGLIDPPATPGDSAYNLAIGHCTAAIRAEISRLKGEGRGS